MSTRASAWAFAADSCQRAELDAPAALWRETDAEGVAFLASGSARGAASAVGWGGGAPTLLRPPRVEIALFNVHGNYHAIEDSCPHAGSSLGAGKLDGTTVTCRAHGLRFDLTTGCMRGAPGLRIRTFPVRVHEGRIQIDLVRPAPEGA